MHNCRLFKQPVCYVAWRKTSRSNISFFYAGWSHTQYQDGTGQGRQECCPDEFLPEGGYRWVWSSAFQFVCFQYTYGHFVKLFVPLSLSWYLCSRSLLIVCCCHERQSSEMKPPIFLSVPNPSWPSEMRPYGKTRWQAQHKGHKTWKSTPWQWQFVSSLHFQTHTTYYNVYNCIILHTITTNTRNTLSGPSRTLFPARNRLYTTANFGKPVY